MKTEFRSSFARDLRAIRDKDLLGRIRAVVESVEQDETLKDVAHVQKLQAEDDFYRIRGATIELASSSNPALWFSFAASTVARYTATSPKHQGNADSLWVSRSPTEFECQNFSGEAAFSCPARPRAVHCY